MDKKRLQLLKKLRNQFTDCEFKVGSESVEIIKAHKAILATSNHVFEAMFFGPIKETIMPLEIPDVEPKSFVCLLKYIYAEQSAVEITQEIDNFDTLVNLMYAAHKYQFIDLMNNCGLAIIIRLTPRNVWKVYDVSKLLNLPKLIEECQEVIIMLTSMALESPDFENVSEETVHWILRQNVLNTCETELISAVEKWKIKESSRTENISQNEPAITDKDELLTKLFDCLHEKKEMVFGTNPNPRFNTEEDFGDYDSFPRGYEKVHIKLSDSNVKEAVLLRPFNEVFKIRLAVSEAVELRDISFYGKVADNSLFTMDSKVAVFLFNCENMLMVQKTVVTETLASFREKTFYYEVDKDSFKTESDSQIIEAHKKHTILAILLTPGTYEMKKLTEKNVVRKMEVPLEGENFEKKTVTFKFEFVGGFPNCIISDMIFFAQPYKRTY